MPSLLCLQTNSSPIGSSRGNNHQPLSFQPQVYRQSSCHRSHLDRKDAFGSIPHPGQRRSGLVPSMGTHPLSTDHHPHASLSNHVGFKQLHSLHASSSNSHSNQQHHLLQQHHQPQQQHPTCHAGITHSLSLGIPSSIKQSHNQSNLGHGVSGGEVLLHKKLDRSMSEPADKLLLAARQATQANSNRYKTELCRPFEENGTCKYGDKCQFAHGMHELRNLLRHPKYKTELCRTFHTTGFCPYGPRCHFIHNSEGQETKKTVMSSLQPTFPAQMTMQSNVQQQVLQSNGGNVNNNHHRVPRLASRSMTSDGLLHNPSSVATPNLKSSLKQCVSSPSSATNSSVVTSQVSRSKAMSVGSFSIGSSGDLSPPSSPSGSPTSLGSFFCEEAFNHAFSSSSAHHHGNGSHASGTTNSNRVNGIQNGINGMQSHSTSNPLHFSFTSTDLNSLFAPTSTSSGQTCQRRASDSKTSFESHCHSILVSGSKSDSCNSSSTSSSSGVGSGMSSVLSSLTSYPGASSSPVDSLDSDLEHHLGSIGRSSSPENQSCSSPLDSPSSSSSSTSSSSSNQAAVPRLPTFAKFANNFSLESE